ncbi:hypothetical protein TGRH88_053410 [Toxoplasma gondii]|uniref:Uncharacterized protein n=1 Tax=Toxoplasma gondii TaxID=5811 RepID=A0A7J6JXX2_TOXGO|nr:hypothetical protein TGRH88_053410 [Toxoplasma gondii]
MHSESQTATIIFIELKEEDCPWTKAVFPDLEDTPVVMEPGLVCPSCTIRLRRLQTASPTGSQIGTPLLPQKNKSSAAG